jgi:hypothetical protein
MKRKHLEHIIRASGKIINEKEFYVIGSQSILGQYPDAPEELLVSNEADIICKIDPSKSDLIDGAIGEHSSFHESFGYYAQGVGFETATLPDGWEKRCIAIQNENTDGYIAYCIELHDTCISKYVANRDKDHKYISECIKNKLIDKNTLLERLSATDLDNAQSNMIKKKIDRDFD